MSPRDLGPETEAVELDLPRVFTIVSTADTPRNGTEPVSIS